MCDEDVVEIEDDTPCQPNDLGFCRWCGRDMQDDDVSFPADPSPLLGLDTWDF